MVFVLGLRSAPCCGCNAVTTNPEVLVRADLAEALQHAEHLAALGQVGGSRHDAQVDGARGEVRGRSTNGHGGGGRVQSSSSIHVELRCTNVRKWVTNLSEDDGNPSWGRARHVGSMLPGPEETFKTLMHDKS